jgi:hypothetical protein
VLRRLGKILTTPQPVQRDEAEAAACAFASELLAHTREELNKADSKAEVLLGVTGIGLGAVAGGLIAQSWSPLALSDSIEWLWWVGVGSALASLGCLVGAVYPRTGRSDIRYPKIIGYYADVVRFESVQALTRALLAAPRPDLRQISDQLHRLSGIVERKYHLIRWGFWLLAAAITSTITSVVLDRFL